MDEKTHAVASGTDDTASGELLRPRLGSPLVPLRWLLPLFVVAALSLQPCAHFLTHLMVEQAFGRPRATGVLSVEGMRAIFAGISFVILVGQLLLTIQLTWGPGRFWVRLLQYWMILALMVGLFYAGEWIKEPVHAWLRPGADPYLLGQMPRLGDRADDWILFLRSLCTIPLVMLGGQLPFWAFRFLFACRLERTFGKPEFGSSVLAGFSIGDLLLGTAIVAVSLGFWQMGERLLQGYDNEARWATLLGQVVLLAAWGLIVGVPLVFVFLQRVRILAAWGLALGAGIALSLVFYLLTERPDATASRWQTLSLACGMAYTVVTTYAGSLTLLRHYGWRLVTGRGPRHAV